MLVLQYFFFFNTFCQFSQFRQENVETANASPMQVSNYTTVNEKKIGNPESPKESSKGGIQDDQLPTSPPLPPPPPDEEVKEIPGGADFPPPPPEFLVLKSAITAPIPPSDSKDRFVQFPILLQERCFFFRCRFFWFSSVGPGWLFYVRIVLICS